jgi:hypothetical protein
MSAKLKPGFKTSEYWLQTLAILLNAVIASDAIVETTLVGKIVFGAVSILAALGYTAARKAAKEKAAE